MGLVTRIDGKITKITAFGAITCPNCLRKYSKKLQLVNKKGKKIFVCPFCGYGIDKTDDPCE